MRAWMASMTLALLGMGALPAWAQETPEEVLRRDLIAQAEAARQRGEHASALDLATRAGTVRMTPSLRLLIAQEHAALGHLVEALDGGRRCGREAEADTALRNRERVLRACESLVSSVEPRLGRVVVLAPVPAVPGLEVRLGGVALSAPLLGTALPVVPGSVVVEASAPEHEPFRRELTLGAGERVEVPLSLTARASVIAHPTPVPVPVPVPPRGGGRTERGRGVAVAPLVVVGLGALSLGAAAVFFALRNEAQADRDAECDAQGVGRCDPVAEQHDADYRTFNALTNVAIGVGLAAMAGGVTWYLLGRGGRETTPRRALRWHLEPARGGAMLGLGGAF